MPIISTTTVGFYSESTIKEMFDIIGKYTLIDQEYWVMLKKDKSMAVIGYTGVRPQDNVGGLYITGVIEFKPTLDISYQDVIPHTKATLQVDGVQINPKITRTGQGYLLYYLLVKAGYVIISDNVQYIGGKKLWEKIVRSGKADGIVVRVVDNGKVVTDTAGNPIDYNGTNIPDNQIWNQPSADPNKSKRYVVLVAKNM